MFVGTKIAIQQLLLVWINVTMIVFDSCLHAYQNRYVDYMLICTRTYKCLKINFLNITVMFT